MVVWSMDAILRLQFFDCDGRRYAGFLLHFESNEEAKRCAGELLPYSQSGVIEVRSGTMVEFRVDSNFQTAA